MMAPTAFDAVTGDALRQELARRRLLDFSHYVDPGYIAEHPHHALADALERVERGELMRLMVSMPPRHGKSMLVSQHFPCWALGRDPERQIVQSGYAIDIALEHSRKARDLFASDKMTRLFPGVRHAPSREGQRNVAVERQAAQEWGTRQGGRYYAVGVGGGLTGRGADIAIIDDPVKNREEAESPRLRQTIWDWYRSTLYTRLSPTGAVVLVMTRWHPDDLAGRILANAAESGEEWEVVRMPAIDPDGQPLCPIRWPLEKLESIRSAIGRHEWSALYQQDPVVRGGNMFEMGGIQLHRSLREFPDTRYVRFWDLASTTRERASDDPDYTAGTLVGLTHANGMPHLWVSDVVAGQWEAPMRNHRILRTAERDGPTVPVLVESVAGYKDTYTTLRDILRGKRSVHKVSVSSDKAVRAAPLEPIFEAGNVHFLRAPWNPIAMRQFEEFPSGAHDDVVDAVAGAYHHLQKHGGVAQLDRTRLGV